MNTRLFYDGFSYSNCECKESTPQKLQSIEINNALVDGCYGKLMLIYSKVLESLEEIVDAFSVEVVDEYTINLLLVLNDDIVNNEEFIEEIVRQCIKEEVSANIIKVAISNNYINVPSNAEFNSEFNKESFIVDEELLIDKGRIVFDGLFFVDTVNGKYRDGSNIADKSRNVVNVVNSKYDDIMIKSEGLFNKLIFSSCDNSDFGALLKNSRGLEFLKIHGVFDFVYFNSLEKETSQWLFKIEELLEVEVTKLLGKDDFLVDFKVYL